MQSIALNLPYSAFSMRAGSGVWLGIVLLGILAGTLDLLVAMAWWAPRGVAPIQILQEIAAWVVGRPAARDGGWSAALFGLVLQCYLMTAMVAGCFALSRRWPALLRRPLAFGAGYGALVYGLQHVLVIPLLSAAPPPALHPDWMLVCLLAYVLLLGIPGALFARLWHGAHPRD